jgi:ribosome recycling factor
MKILMLELLCVSVFTISYYAQLSLVITCWHQNTSNIEFTEQLHDLDLSFFPNPSGDLIELRLKKLTVAAYACCIKKEKYAWIA